MFPASASIVRVCAQSLIDGSRVSRSHVGCDATDVFGENAMTTKNPFLFPINLFTLASSESGCEWWLVHTKPRQEKKLAGELRILGVPHYLPATLCKSVTVGSGRYSWSPLFPGYMFLKCTSDQRLTALRTNRIVTIHVVSGKEAIETHLFDLSDLIEKDVPLRIEERLTAGQEVQVKAGPLKGKCGIVVKRGGKARLFIMIPELLGGVSLEIEQHFVEPN